MASWLQDDLVNKGNVVLHSLKVRYVFTDKNQYVKIAFCSAISPVAYDMMTALPQSFYGLSSSFNFGNENIVNMTVPVPYGSWIQPPDPTKPEALLIISASKGVDMSVCFNVNCPGLKYNIRAFPAASLKQDEKDREDFRTSRLQVE